MPQNKQILLDNRPQGEASVSNFRLAVSETPPLREGEVLVRHHFISLDPYMRGRMNDAKSYAAPQPLGQVMQGGTVGEVVESRSPKFQVGDKVVGMGGWQQYSVVDAGPAEHFLLDVDEFGRGAAVPGALRKVDTTNVPLSHYLGAVGMPGVTAWYGLVRIIEPQAGETMVVSAAAGAVGSAFGVLAKTRGCRTVGVAGGPEKCRYVVDELGFDACVDYKQYADAASLSKALRDACPQGIDGYFENVGGMVMDAVMLRMNAFGRIALCGMIAGYDGQPVPMSYPQLLLTSRIKLQGFIVSEHMEDWPQALAELRDLVGSGKLRPRESVAQGLEAAPEAFLGLLKGRNFGKQLVKLI